MNDITPAPRLDPTHLDFLTRTEQIVQEVVESKDFEAGFGFINDLTEHGKTFDRAKGMMLEGLESVWNPAEQEGETFYAAALRKTGLSPITVERHIKIQKLLTSNAIPEQYREPIEANHGQKELIRIANLVEGGYEIEEDDWQKISDVRGEKEVGRVTREITGKPPRSNWLSITMDARGVLYEHTNGGTRECGRLNIHDDHPDVQKAINRITGCAGIQPASEY